MATIKDILASSRFASTPANFKIYSTPLPEFQLKRGNGPTFHPDQPHKIIEFSIPLSPTLQIDGSFTKHDDTDRFQLNPLRLIPKRFNLK